MEMPIDCTINIYSNALHLQLDYVFLFWLTNRAPWFPERISWFISLLSVFRDSIALCLFQILPPWQPASIS